ncbi:MAG: glucosaminidase domain-containing protein [Saprospiraceae bacterium]|nr:glucosaminidase domain-containing protein [Saprospiraceae bacterium]
MSLGRVLIFIVSICLMSFNFNPDIAASEYISYYKDLAIVEMYRSGIPASITLAQGLHESNYGTSKLATEANNHFGIKCKTYWTGRTYYHKDDDFNKKGQLIESCFRAYESDIDSYIDRSNYLMQTERYKALFDYDKTAYSDWAFGLKYCGYATDENYATKLIEKIEKYHLYKYDTSEDPFRQLIKN